MENIYELNMTSVIIRIVLSMLCGGLIGLERSIKSRPAGFRTYMIVCLSSSLVMMTNEFIFNKFSGGDPARLGAQVISGIGFLGAGTILVTSRSQVKGLTSAAGLWSSACLGLAIGIGFYYGAIIVAVAVLLIVTLFKKIEGYITSNNKTITLYTSFSSLEHFDKFISYCHKLNFKMTDIEISKDSSLKELSVIAILVLESNKTFNHTETIHKFSSFEGLIHLEEL
ncbi:MgtC/SapB family protein [Sedimentibacter hydroxybenzoicus DSM 7310]|uniref:MgtC/SapB family protein n=1 Tax=Sedimentibacter hydroxybenzoicus DSM 7310 TaxID=1123245 RepID=A0A974BK72_SEDHY|nr:MgtC/SapB family protein [Sedimentibacter hydroxybenzoicus]NYB74381.1 MgtC/SapB family protein [Sedimentibacter hydroxybenzoicus DSM 7310]